MARILALLPLLTLAATDPSLKTTEGFFLGLIEGLQKIPAVPSQCLQKLPEVSQAYQEFSLGLQSGILGNALITARDLVNVITLFETTCQFQTFTRRIINLISPDSLEEFGIILVANLEFFSQSFKNLQSAIANGVSYDTGFYFGQIVSKSLNFYL